MIRFALGVIVGGAVAFYLGYRWAQSRKCPGQPSDFRSALASGALDVAGAAYCRSRES